LPAKFFENDSVADLSAVTVADLSAGIVAGLSAGIVAGLIGAPFFLYINEL
jgi:ABC-type Fe3+-siderophore transport system permease subunit